MLWVQMDLNANRMHLNHHCREKVGTRGLHDSDLHKQERHTTVMALSKERHYLESAELVKVPYAAARASRPSVLEMMKCVVTVTHHLVTWAVTGMRGCRT